MLIRQAALALLVLSLPGLRLHAQETDLAAQSRSARQALLAGHYQDAVALYRKLVDALPSNFRLRLSLGLALEKAGDPAAAVRELEKVTRAEPDLAAAWFLLGLAHQQLKHPGQAIQPLQQAVRLDGKNEQALLELADAELSAGKSRDAIRDFTTLSQHTPRSAKAWQGLGMSYVALGEDFFKRIEQQYPNSGYWYALAARSHEGAGQHAEALRLYKKAVDANPALPGIQAAQAEIYRKTNHPDWAAEEEKREKKIPAPKCQMRSAGCAYRKGEWEAALSAPANSAEDLYWTALASGQLAAQTLARLEQLPPSPEIHEILARANQRMGRRMEALAEWKRALALDPGNSRLQGRLAESLYRVREYPESERLLTSLVARQPENADWQYLLGSVLFDEHRDADALPHLLQAVRSQPDSLPAQAALGRVYLNLDQPAKAAAFLERASTLNDRSLFFALSTAYRRSGQAAKSQAALARYQSLSGQSGTSPPADSGNAIPPP